jgi:hypothetical protein
VGSSSRSPRAESRGGGAPSARVFPASFEEPPLDPRLQLLERSKVGCELCDLGALVSGLGTPEEAPPLEARDGVLAERAPCFPLDPRLANARPRSLELCGKRRGASRKGVGVDREVD